MFTLSLGSRGVLFQVGFGGSGGLVYRRGGGERPQLSFLCVLAPTTMTLVALCLSHGVSIPHPSLRVCGGVLIC